MKKRSKEARRIDLTDANKRFDMMLMWIHDRIYVRMRWNTKEVWIGRSNRVWTESKGIRWESNGSPVVHVTKPITPFSFNSLKLYLISLSSPGHFPTLQLRTFHIPSYSSCPLGILSPLAFWTSSVLLGIC